MADKFKTLDPKDIQDNPFKLIADDWFLLTAGTKDSFNTMTASWGTFGELWHRKVCTVFVRPVRHTYEFIEKAETFTLSFFDEQHRNVLKYCGHKSGRDVNKTEKTGITPVETESGSVYFEEARMVIECRKLYTHDLDPGRFLDPGIEKEYPKKDYHRMYIGEITRVLKK